MNPDPLSSDDAEINTLSCASCGIIQSDQINLKKCAACKLVSYCSVTCQKAHRPSHKEACEQKVAELRDEILFKLPESRHSGDCPICFLPLPLNEKEQTIQTCCFTTICNGCKWAHRMSLWGVSDNDKLNTCPFCRQIAPRTHQLDNYLQRRVEANDPAAMTQLGDQRVQEQNYHGALEMWNKAAALGDADAHYQLAVAYYNEAVLPKDAAKEKYHLEEAAIRGHVMARNNLAVLENECGNRDRAIRHFMIAASQGHDGALATIREWYVKGFVTKDQFAQALRAHKAAVDATKSEQRANAPAHEDWLPFTE